ncbi:MAG TPA: chain length determinant protein EpsF [Burkholderiales bacterium]
MSLYQLLLILRARKWIVFAALAVGVVAALAVNILMPKQYTATATVVVDSKATDAITGNLLPPPLMATQLEVIRSHRVALDVVNGTRLTESPIARQQFVEQTENKGSIKDWWADRLLLNTDVKARRDSNLIDIQFTAQDSRFASLVANAFARAYMDVTLALTLEPFRQTSSFYDEQLKNLRTNLERAQARLAGHLQRYGIVVTDERLDVENSRLEELYSQLAQVQADARDASTRERKAAEYAKAGRSPEEIPEVLANPLIQSLKSELLRAEAKLKETSAILGPRHPQYQKQKSEIDALRQKLDQEIGYAVGGMTTLSSIHATRAAELTQAVAAQKEKMLRLKGQRDEASVLQADVESAQKSYDAAQQRYTTTTLASRTSNTNVAMLNPAVEPAEPSSPKIFRNLLVGIIAGLIVGLNLAFAFEVFDRRVRTGEDIGAELALPVLGVMEGRSGTGRYLLPARSGGHRLLGSARPKPA